MKLTADTITDEQIRELREWIVENPSVVIRGVRESRREAVLLCDWALTPGHVQRHAARASCAEILNARNLK